MVTKRARLWLTRGTAVTVSIVVVVLSWSTWYYSGQIEKHLLAIRPTDPAPGRMTFGDDPLSRSISFDEVLVDGPLGDLPAWLTQGVDDTWVLFVHGVGADRREALRALPAAQAIGYPTLTVTYRNDAGAPPSGSGRHGLGRNEWMDLEAAVKFALAEGARDVVLVGYGSGGSIVSVFLRHSRVADRVVGVVLDAPVLDAGFVVDRMAAIDRVPGFIVGWSKAMATFRFGVDWSELDHVLQAERLEVPVLVFHGTGDSEVSIASSEAYAEARPELVTLVPVVGAGHGESWNVDPDAYEATMAAFLEDVAGGESELEPVEEE